MPTANLPGLMLDRADPLSRGLIVCWAMNEGAGRRVNDLAQGMDGISTLGGWQGTPYGTGIVTSASPSSVVAGQRVTLSSLPTGAKSRSIWWAGRCDSVTGWRWCGSYGHWNGNEGWMLGANGTTLVGSTVFTDLTSASFWEVGKVTTVAYTYDGTTARLYGDGILKNSSTPTPNTTLGYLNAGVNTGQTEFWAGVTNGMRIYDRALTAQEIATLHVDPLAGAKRRSLFYIDERLAILSQTLDGALVDGDGNVLVKGALGKTLGGAILVSAGMETQHTDFSQYGPKSGGGRRTRGVSVSKGPWSTGRRTIK